MNNPPDDEQQRKLVEQLSRADELRDETAVAIEAAIRTDFSVIQTLFELAVTRMALGHIEDSKRAEASARRGIAQIRHLLSRNKLSSAASKASMSKRCDELERTQIH